MGQEEQFVTNIFGEDFISGPGVSREVGPLGDRVYYSRINDGIQLIFSDNKLAQITLHIKPGGGFRSYNGDLPVGLSNEMHFDEVVGLLGSPDVSGGGNDDPLFGRIFPWIKYENMHPKIHIEMGLKGGIERISLS
ncbi:hypothetical protein XarjCFBP8253_21585 [Xanthomonas arboricola pv. juglandis]|uniref:Uncharacterized protein n=1 Tax=Xanthomonas campestris pv. juglandis TaxID=195709 RepID=A0A8E4EM16_XANCJ|nr:hypothetical protein XarjCFBP8253_21585 [Xanthomonas arboricola pv. juglandis]CAD1791100.1 hypothetical protein XSP_001811 [Xanthomonas arboricola pv. juglandis]CAD7350137.1 hypothetical protein X12_002571 [Xanthomonas arboricola]